MGDVASFMDFIMRLRALPAGAPMTFRPPPALYARMPGQFPAMVRQGWISGWRMGSDTITVRRGEGDIESTETMHVSTFGMPPIPVAQLTRVEFFASLMAELGRPHDGGDALVFSVPVSADDATLESTRELFTRMRVIAGWEFDARTRVLRVQRGPMRVPVEALLPNVNQ